MGFYDFLSDHTLFVAGFLICCFLFYNYIIKPRIERRENGMEKERRSTDTTTE